MKVRLVALCAASLLSLAACGGGSSSSDAKGPSVTKKNSAQLVEKSPLTGLTVKDGLPTHPVFYVKVENTEGGQPQYGLNKADMVFEELVEGGLTRLGAFYYSTIPSKIGHVRSMRATDIGIASPVNGQIVASGGAESTYRRVKSAGVKVWSEDHGAPGFSSDPLKVRPYNRLVDLKTIAKKAGTAKVPGNYFQWGTASATPTTSTPSSGSTTTAAKPQTATSADVGFSGSSHTRWTFTNGTWQRVNGHAAAGQDFKADTLMVLRAKVGNAGYLDPAGNTVPETIFEGSGKATILAGKTVVQGTWHKKTLDSELTFTDASGKTITIAPGHVWVELIPKDGGSLSLG